MMHPELHGMHLALMVSFSATAKYILGYIYTW